MLPTIKTKEQNVNVEKILSRYDYNYYISDTTTTGGRKKVEKKT